MKTNFHLQKLLVLAFLLFVLNTRAQNRDSSAGTASNQFAALKLTYKIINAPNQTFGYDIYVDERKLVHQPSIPALSGNAGFKTKTDAIKVAQLVIAKIKQGEMPPTVTIEEMKKLHVIE